jgi:hypothetical protein
MGDTSGIPEPMIFSADDDHDIDPEERLRIAMARQ